MKTSVRIAFLVLGLLPVTDALAESTRPKTCLVLSGGGARGLAHVGVLRALEEQRVPIDCIVGTSMGAIIGGAYATGMTATELEDVVRDMDWDRVLSDQPARTARSVRSKELERRRLIGAEVGVGRAGTLLPLGAIVGSQLSLFLNGLIGPPVSLGSFDELRIPFRAIATNIETGRPVVLHRGSLAEALRASMSVPGVFAPAEIDGALLADGGLVRNLGIDVAREMGAERIIAVNLGTPLLDRDELTSVIGITEQVINILTEQNVERSLAEIGPQDVLIRPALGDFSAADFARSLATIPLGEQAAREAATSLAAFAVGDAEYQAWRAARTRRTLEGGYAGIDIDTSGLAYSNPWSVQTAFHDAADGKPWDVGLRRGIEQLIATDDFQQVSLRAEPRPGGTALVVAPVEKHWGPDYVRLGLTMSTDLEGESAFTLLGDYRATWLNDRGLEFRSGLALGARTGLDTELFQPLNDARSWFGAVRAGYNTEIAPVYVPGSRVRAGRYRTRRADAGFDVGRFLGTVGEVRLGYELSDTQLERETGLLVPPDGEARAGKVALRALVDDLDDWDFPRSGWYGSVFGTYADPDLGGDGRFDQYAIEVQRAFGRDRHSVTLGARYGKTNGERIPITDLFRLGGFHNLSGLDESQLLGRGVTFARAVYGYALGSRGSMLRSVYVGASLEAGEIHDRVNGPDGVGGVLAGSLYIAADTAAGPIYLGAGQAEGGSTAIYLFIGRP